MLLWKLIRIKKVTLLCKKKHVNFFPFQISYECTLPFNMGAASASQGQINGKKKI